MLATPSYAATSLGMTPVAVDAQLLTRLVSAWSAVVGHYSSAIASIFSSSQSYSSLSTPTPPHDALRTLQQLGKLPLFVDWYFGQQRRQ